MCYVLILQTYDLSTFQMSNVSHVSKFKYTKNSQYVNSPKSNSFSYTIRSRRRRRRRRRHLMPGLFVSQRVPLQLTSFTTELNSTELIEFNSIICFASLWLHVEIHITGMLTGVFPTFKAHVVVSSLSFVDFFCGCLLYVHK